MYHGTATSTLGINMIIRLAKTHPMTIYTAWHWPLWLSCI